MTKFICAVNILIPYLKETFYIYTCIHTHTNTHVCPVD